MKFSSSLKFNAVADWWDEYIAYDGLKKHIYQLEKTQHGRRGYTDAEAAAGEQAGDAEADAVFVPLLDGELAKICAFYERMEGELMSEVTELEEAVQQQESAGEEQQYVDDEEDEEEDDEEDSVSRSPERRRLRAGHRRMSLSVSGRRHEDIRRSISSISSDGHGEQSPSALGRLANKLTPEFMRSSVTSERDVWTAKTDFAYDTRLLFKRRITTLYISLTNLRSYVEVNYSGFRKILKKYDKLIYRDLLTTYLPSRVQSAPPFTPAARATLSSLTHRLIDLYAKCVTRGDRPLAKQQLRLNQRENIAWERNTVWRTMIGRERGRTGNAVTVGVVGDEDDSGGEVGGGLLGGVGAKGAGRLRITRKGVAIFAAVAVFLALLQFPVIPGVQENRCFAILMFCTVLWATEAIPLFVTSLTVPLLLVTMSVIRGDDGAPLPPKAAASVIFSLMFSPTIMLLIGGFTISSALSKTDIDRVLITRVLSLAGSRPSRVLLAFMGVACFASMWISNVAAPTLCFTLIRPILRTLPPNSPFAPCLILAIALAANIGGQSSPISSPQNLIALAAMDPPVSWAAWFAVALPVSLLSLLLIWALLLASYRPPHTLEIRALRAPTAAQERFGVTQWWVTAVCGVTIALWVAAPLAEAWAGDMGVVALIPVIAFFATGVLRREDFERFAWTIVFLAMGGIALGKGVERSGLLEVFGEAVRVRLGGAGVYQVVLVLAPIVLVVSTFISHTIASVLLVPIAKEIGASLPVPYPNLLIFVTGLICSAGMGMPVSGFPNQTAATQEDDLGVLYLSNVDFLKNGVPASIIATLVVATVGYLLMLAVGVR